MTERYAHMPSDEPPQERPPTPDDQRSRQPPIREPSRDPKVKDPPPDEKPNPKRY